jgi:hypothetical protein
VALAPAGEVVANANDSSRPFPKRWDTPAALRVLRSDWSNREVAKKLAISVGHAQRLRRILARDSGEAA